MIYITQILANATLSQSDQTAATLLLLLAFVYVTATLFTFIHCIIRCENDDRPAYAIMILVLPFAGSVLYWKNRPDVFNMAITMAYPRTSEKEKMRSEEKHRAPATPRFSTPPFTAATAKATRYSSPPFATSSARPSLRTSNTTPPFAPESPAHS